MSSQYGVTTGKPSIPQSTRISTEKGGPPSPAQKRDGVRLSTTSKFKRIISTQAWSLRQNFLAEGTK